MTRRWPMVLIAIMLLDAGISTSAQSATEATLEPTTTTNTSGIPASFFGMTTVDASDYPPLPVGAVGHPPTFAWGWVEQSRGLYKWSVLDKHIANARDHHIDILVTFGQTPASALANQSSCKDKYYQQLIASYASQ